MTSDLIFAFPPVGSANSSSQVEHRGGIDGLSKITCSFPHLAHLTLTKLLFGFGINSPLTMFIITQQIPSKMDGGNISVMALSIVVSRRVAETAFLRADLYGSLGNLEFSEPDSKSVDYGVACSAGESKQLLLGCFCSAL